MSIQKLFNRAYDVGRASPELNPKQRLAAAAQSLSLAGDMQAHLDVAEASIVALIDVLYAVDADQRPANVDAVTGRILIPLPWGSSGWRHWGLRKWESECLRKIMVERSKVRKPAPLFCFDHGSRQWFADMELYPTAEDALGWLKDKGPTLGEWRQAVDDYRAKAHDRMMRHRLP